MKTKSYFAKISWRPKKKVFAVSWSVSPSKSTFSRNLVPYSAGIYRFIHVGWLFFVWSSSAQISMGGGTLTLDGKTCFPASPLQFKYCAKGISNSLNLWRSVHFKGLSFGLLPFIGNQTTNNSFGSWGVTGGVRLHSIKTYAARFLRPFL